MRGVIQGTEFLRVLLCCIGACSLLEQVVLLSDYPLIVGDFNIHVDNPDDSEAADFDSLLNSFGLC